MSRPDRIALVSGLLLWVLALLVVAAVVTAAGLVPLSLAATVGLLAAGGVLLAAVLAFVRYYGEGERRVF